MTRDRHLRRRAEAARPFRVVDTGRSHRRRRRAVRARDRAAGRAALAEAALVLFVVDARGRRDGARPRAGRDAATPDRPVLLVANKVDGPAAGRMRATSFTRLGLGEPLAVSAEHARGIEELLAAIESRLPPPVADAEESPGRRDQRRDRRTAQRRQVVDPQSPRRRGADDGQRRPGHDARRGRHGPDARLAPLPARRHRGDPPQGACQRDRGVASRRCARAQAIERADVVVLVLDASEPIAAQDAHIAGYAVDAGRPIVVAVNKWDLVEGREDKAKAWEREMRERLRFAKEVAFVLVSAKSGQRVVKILDRVDEAFADAGIRVPTPELNRWLQEESAKERSGPRQGRERPIVLRHADRHPSAALRRLLQRGQAPPFLAATASRELAARALPVRRGPAALDVPRPARARVAMRRGAARFVRRCGRAGPASSQGPARSRRRRRLLLAALAPPPFLLLAGKALARIIPDPDGTAGDVCPRSPRICRSRSRRPSRR